MVKLSLWQETIHTFSQWSTLWPCNEKGTNIIRKSKARNYSRKQTELVRTARRQMQQILLALTKWENVRKWTSAQLKWPELQGQSTVEAKLEERSKLTVLWI